MLELSADNGQQGPRTEGSASENRIVRGQSSPSGVRSLLDNGSTVESERIACLRVTGSEIGRVAPGARRGEDLMAQAAQKITLSSSRDIPFDKLVLS
ncbi:MAG: hypothetical protein E6R09_13780, partial [Rhodocyclaceae bacterium]